MTKSSGVAERCAVRCSVHPHGCTNVVFAPLVKDRFILVLNSRNSAFYRISTFYGILKTLYPILSLQKLKKLLVEIQSGNRPAMRVCGGNIQISPSVAYKTGPNCIRLYQKSEI